jgi:hypothetical protein
LGRISINKSIKKDIAREAKKFGAIPIKKRGIGINV